MPVHLRIHRGADAIGGTCVELAAEGKRLILDIGLPLMKNGGGDLDAESVQNPTVCNGVVPDVSGLIDGDPSLLGVVISHAHLDHYGLAEHLHASIPVFMSEESKALIGVANIFYPEQARLPSVLDRCTAYNHGSSFTIGPFTVTPYLMDHSAFGASSLLIEACGKRILYSGDMRAHGRKAALFRALPRRVGHVDCMLMEGTTLGGRHHVGYDSEAAVEEGLVEVFRHNHATLVLGSGSNVDWLVSLYRASKRTNKLLVIDLYQYYLLTRLKRFSPSLPPHEGDHIRVFYPRSQAKALEEHGLVSVMTKEAFHRRISREKICSRPEKMVVRLALGEMARLAKQMPGQERLRFVYSMWRGYLERDPRMADFPRQYGGEWKCIHASGHAWLEDLQWLTKQIQPTMLVPIHSLHGDDFLRHFPNVVRILDGEEITI